MKSTLKVLASAILIILLIYGVTKIHQGLNKGVQNRSSNTVHNVSSKTHGTPTVASIVYLYQGGLPPQTLESLQAMGATEVYLYAAEYSQAYYSVGSNPYGVIVAANVLQQACETLHQHGYKVVVVISSALIAPGSRTAAGQSISQGNSVILNPATAQPFLVQMVKQIVSYPVDGLYVGEPYNAQYSAMSTAQRASQARAWDKLYSRLVLIAKQRRVPFDMILPDFYENGTSRVAGLPNDFTNKAFAQVGVDAENAYTGNDQLDMKHFAGAIKTAQTLANGRPDIIELSLREGDLKTPVPPAFFRQEVQLAAKDHVDTIVIFANEFWWNSPYQTDYASALQAYEQGGSR